jgi:tellurium resistance protein TerD
MALTLSKGANLSLTKTDPGLVKALVGLGWDARSTNGDEFDLDASALLIGANGKVRSDADFIFYNQPADAAQSVVYQGDNRTGAGDGDDEQILIDLSLVPADVERVVITVSIHDAVARNQSFGQVRNSYVRILNNETQVEIAKFELGEEVSTENSVVFAEVYRHAGDWKFKAVGQGFTDGLLGIARDFGVNL